MHENAHKAVSWAIMTGMMSGSSCGVYLHDHPDVDHALAGLIVAVCSALGAGASLLVAYAYRRFTSANASADASQNRKQ